MTRRTERALLAVVVASHATLLTASLWVKSATFDETTHLPAGLAALATGDVRLNPQHPPLVKLLAALAASLQRPSLPLDGEAYRVGAEWDFGRAVLFEAGNDPVALLRAARLPMVALSVVCLLFVHRWSRTRWGRSAGLFSISLAAFAPTLLAHGRLVTMDVPVAAGCIATLYLFWRVQRRPPHLGRETAFGLALGLALATKFSALLLLPALALCQILSGDAGRGWRSLRPWAVALPTALLVLWLAYLAPANPLRYFADLVFLHGDHPSDYVYYLAGEFRTGSFPHYFLVAVAVKSALPGLAAALAGLALAARSRDRWRDDLYLWLPAALWIAAHSALADDLGVRYVLPAYPLLFVLAGALVPWARARRSPLPRLAVGALALAQAITAWVAHPDYISYFNPAAGGRLAGPRWLDDSNLDWGQELQRLSGWLAERGVTGVRLLPFGTAVPEAYGVATEPFPEEDWKRAPRPGAYVVSAHWLVHGLHMAARDGVRTDWLRRYQPRDVLGGSLYLYVFPEAEPERSPPIRGR